MFMQQKFILLCIFSLIFGYSSVYANDKVETRFGLLEVRGERYASSLSIDGKSFYSPDAGENFYIERYFQLYDVDVVVINPTTGGSGSLPYFFFVTLRENSKPIISKYYSIAGGDYDKVAIIDGYIVVNLGFEKGLKRILRYDGEKIKIEKHDIKREPAKESDCQYLYENMYVPYSEQGECDDSPEMIGGMATSRSYYGLSEDSRLDMKKFQSLAESGCSSRKTIIYQDFKNQVCGFVLTLTKKRTTDDKNGADTSANMPQPIEYKQQEVLAPKAQNSTLEKLPPGFRYTKSGNVAALSEELLDKAFDYLVAKDEVAFQRLLNTGTVFFLKGGLKVQVVKMSFFGGRVKVRPMGKTIEFWTVTEALEK